ncbi:hypothetical protein RKD41_006736 [Streptomyces tendae]
MVAAVALREQAAFAVGRGRAALADQVGEVGVPGRDVLEPRLQEAHPGVPGFGRRERAADRRPGAVRADDEVALERGPVGEPQLTRTVGWAGHGTQSPAPVHGARQQRVQQETAQHTPVDLRLEPLVGLGDMVEEDRAGRVQLTHLLPLRPGKPEERVQEAGLAQGDLAVVGVQIERAALVAGVRAGVPVVDGDGDAVPLEDAGAGQAAGAGADDRDAGCRSAGHGCSVRVGSLGEGRRRQKSTPTQ